MKKKSMMLGGLLAAVVVTAYSVSGTYAKYISQVDLTDSARVAKWGFTLTDADGSYDTGMHTIDLFSNSYSKVLADNNKYTMVESLSATKDNVVAPGTTGTYEFELEGEMETRYILKFKVAADAKDIVVYYGKDANDKVVVGKTAEEATAAGAVSTPKEYRPVTYTILYNRTGNFTKTEGGAFNDPKTIVVGENVDTATLETTLNQHVVNHPEGFKPGQLDQHYQINWQWKTQQTGGDLTDAEWNEVDTWIGKNLTANDKIVFGVQVIAEQVAEDYSKDSAKVQP